LQSGSFSQLKQKLGDDLPIKTFLKKTPIIAITASGLSEEGRTFLKSRKLTDDVINQFSYNSGFDKVGFIYKTSEGVPYLTKWRKISEKRFFSEPKGIDYAAPFNYQDFEDKSYIIICEGEIDCMSWVQYNYKNAVAVPGAGTFRGEWINLFAPYKLIYLNLDMDKAGEVGSEKIQLKLEKSRCKKIILPAKDINECLMAGVSKENIDTYFKNAISPKNKNILKGDKLKLSKLTALEKGVTTGLDSLDKLTLWRPHEVTVLTAETKHGKSTFCLFLAYNQLIQQKPVLIGSFELGHKKSHEKLASMFMDKSYYSLSEEEVDKFNKLAEKIPVYYIQRYGCLEIKEIKECIYHAHIHYDVNFFILDHLHFFMQPTSDSNNQAKEIGQTIREIQSWVKELNIHIWLVVQPKNVNDRKINFNDLRGSSEIKQTVDNIFIVEANKDDSSIELDLQIARHDTATLGKIRLRFDKDKQKYYELSKEEIKSKKIKENFAKVFDMGKILAEKDENDKTNS
jgi:twinkle protein